MKRIYLFIVTVTLIFSGSAVYSQNIGINADGTPPDANAMLDIKAFNKGLLIPRTSTASRIAIPNTKGLLVYDTTLNSFWYNDGANWQQISNGAALNGTTNYIAKFTGTNTLGNSQIVDNGQYVGIGTTTPSARLHVADSSVLFSAVRDIPATAGNPPVSGEGRRMMWYPDKAAFRTGYATGTEWDTYNVGNYSFAEGNGTTASGLYSLAAGYSAKASGVASSAIGFENTASGDYSVGLGKEAIASGLYSFASGYFANASGEASAALGENNTASGNYSFAEGVQSEASGEASIAMGLSNSRGDYSFAAGNNCNANSRASVALGEDVTTDGISSFATGLSNVTSGSYAFASGTFATAKATLSIAMGQNVTAGGANSFVWGVNSNTTGRSSLVMGINLFDGGHKGNAMLGDTDPWNAGSVGSGTDDQMICRFNNGYYFLTGGNTNRTGMVANHGDNSWSQISDSTKKEKIVPIDGENLLNKIATFKLCTWNYKGQDPKIFRHYGPMAQDFHNAFGRDAIGSIGNDSLINQADFLGVSFTAIQALEKRTEKIEQQQKQISDLEKHNEILSASNDKLQQQLQTLLSTVATLDKKVETLASSGNKVNSVAVK